ncbi:MAG: hypothetical protein CM15mP49_15300 [Actinomycetota bacterium]|nr:MAG: hypothetical protein CM15mP49_15300 [Actinomycetota bacterium]
MLTNTELSIPEDSTWTIKWSATGATAGSFSETTLDTDLEKDCSNLSLTQLLPMPMHVPLME